MALELFELLTLFLEYLGVLLGLLEETFGISLQRSDLQTFAVHILLEVVQLLLVLLQNGCAVEAVELVVWVERERRLQLSIYLLLQIQLFKCLVDLI